ncbi:PAF15 factor, partial [Dasyornis broadbenti]|nr:PAF15 factor [Dasyornis broadbenti]
QGRAGFRVLPLTPRCPPVPAVLISRAPRKALGSSSINAGPPPASRRGDKRPVGLNRVCVRPVPAWQKGIGDFLKLPAKENRAPDGDAPGTSGLGARPLPPDPAEDRESLEEE